ncbi:hypothetical protein M432DRAFT_20552 [Thermoascus aurantiacus ATCC 26904]
MKVCLRPGRPTYLGRRLYLPRLCDLSHRSYFTNTLGGRNCLARGQWTRQFSFGCPRREDSRDLLDHSWLRESVLAEAPPSPLHGSQRRDPNAWIALLEQYLPPSLREGAGDGTKTEDSSGSKKNVHEESRAIATLLYQARHLENLDLLAHLGFELRRWPAVHALVNKLLDSTEALKAVSKVQLPSNIEWGPDSSLDDITSDALNWKPAEVRIKSDEQSSSASKIGLDVVTDRPLGLWQSQMIMREVWQSLAFIILEAADLPSNESKQPISYVYQILARLHHSGSIPDSVYKYLRPQDEEAPFRPPGMFLLSTHIMNVLSDAMWLVHEAEVSAKAAAAGNKSPYRPFKMAIRELGPEVWLEFVLWCCVEEGFVKEGVWILQRMKAREGDLAWNVKSWKPLLQHPELVRDTKIDVEDFWRRPGDPPVSRMSKSPTGVFYGLGKRTISVEVITSLMDGVANLVYRGLGYRGLSPRAVLQYLVFLNSLLARATKEDWQSANRVSNWSVVRMIESGGIDPQADPQALERLLRGQSWTVLPWDDNTSTLEEELNQLRRQQIYDDSSALIGLLEYNLRSYAAHRHTGGALDVFAWLQELVDTSKLQHIHRFLEKARELDDEDLSAPDQQHRSSLSNNLYRSSIPQLSNATLADLLDLVTTSGAFRFGEWLLFSTDVDGPVIPLDAYGDQALAPSIIRFATATRNTPLCNQVVESLSQPVSRNTLKALLNFRITMGDWDRVVTMFEYLRDHKAKSWGDSNVTALAAAVLKLDRSAKRKIPPTPEKEESLSKAKDILLRLLNGEFNTPPDPSAGRMVYQERALYRLHQVFMSIPGPLEEICRKAELKYKPASSRDIIPYIPSVAFHNLLAAVVAVQGSAAGKKLWERWCLERPSPETERLYEGGVQRLYTTDERDYRMGDPVFDPTWLEQAQKKAVIPNLNTVRIIAHAAVKEYAVQKAHPKPPEEIPSPSSDDSTEQPPSSSTVPGESVEDILDFCVEKFRMLRLGDKEIDREVQGHLSRMKKRKMRELEQEQENHKNSSW